MRLATRTFLLCFLPFAILLLGSFAALQTLTERAVRERLRASLEDTSARVVALNARRDEGSAQWLRMAGQSPELMAGMRLVIVERSAAARAALQDQLREISRRLGIEIMAVKGPAGELLAKVAPPGAESASAHSGGNDPPGSGIWGNASGLYRMTSAAICQGEENLGAVTVGRRLDLSEFMTPVAVTSNGKAVAASLPRFSLEAISEALRACPPEGECDVKLGGHTYLSAPLAAAHGGAGYAVRSLLDVDLAAAPALAVLRSVFSVAAAIWVIAGLLAGAFFSRSLDRPIRDLIDRLQDSESTGRLYNLPETPGQIREFRALTNSFNRAAASVREAQTRLVEAYIEFTASLCSALDARDGYTAGHGRRVSNYSVAICAAMGLSEEETETVRIGAMLHDIGKIGISDIVLLKPGRLTADEKTVIQKHPVIGRRILERIRGFERYLPVVELHHENWDGTGYPYHLRGIEVDRAARIVHVADAFDAMTTNRPYRRRMGSERALTILRDFAGTQFDPELVAVFVGLVESGKVDAGMAAGPAQPTDSQSVVNLAEALAASEPVAEASEKETERV